MTLIYELYLDILKMGLHSENELCRLRLTKITALQTDKDTYVTENINTSH